MCLLAGGIYGRFWRKVLSKLTIQTPEGKQWLPISVFIFDLEQVFPQMETKLMILKHASQVLPFLILNIFPS